MNHRFLIFILAALAMTGALSIDAYLPALPAMAHEFGVSMATAQQTLTVYTLAFAFMTLFYGTLSDSFGRKSIILGTLTLYLLSSVGAGCTHSFHWLLFFRMLQGLTAGAGPVISDAIVVDLLSGAEAQRAMSYISVIFGLAPAAAPILGGWLQATWGWRSVFFFIASFIFILLVICFWFLPESLPRAKRQPFHFKTILVNYWRVACHLQFVQRGLAIALFFSGIIIYLGAAPVFVMTMLHLSVKDFGWLFIPLIGGGTLGSLLSGRLSHRLTPNTIIHVGYGISLFAAGVNLIYAMLWAPAIPWAVMPLSLYSFGLSLALPAMTVTALTMFPDVRGLASSLLTFIIMSMFAFGFGAICPLLFASDYHLALGVMVGLCLSLLGWQLSMSQRALNPG